MLSDTIVRNFTQGGKLFLKMSLLHGPSMFAVNRAIIHGVLYKQSSSIAFDETSSYWSAPESS